MRDMNRLCDLCVIPLKFGENSEYTRGSGV